MAVTCRVLGFSTQAYYKWLKNPFSARGIEERELIGKLHELHEEDPEGGYRVLADDLEDAGHQVTEGNADGDTEEDPDGQVSFKCRHLTQPSRI